VSRTALREALSALTHLNVLETLGKAKYGNVARARAHLVARTSAKSAEDALVSDPLEVRRMLEPEAAALAAERASADVLGEIEEWLRLMEEAGRRGERGIEYDSAFHVSIARATGNATLVELVGALSDATRASRNLSFEPREAVEAALADHRAIVEAIRRHDPEQARQAMIRHLDHVERLIRWSLTAGRRGHADADDAPR
jgi:GntR family transcriptional repressor for pyruvate dehydrogenase complex